MAEGFLLGVVADSHLYSGAVMRVAPLLSGVDAIAHLGDGAFDAVTLHTLTGKLVYMVSGNNDRSSEAPEERIETLGGTRVLMCHGHRRHVKASLLFLALRAQEAEAKLALYGHTHVPAVDWKEGVLLVNPGSLANGRYALIRFGENGPAPKLMRM